MTTNELIKKLESLKETIKANADVPDNHKNHPLMGKTNWKILDTVCEESIDEGAITYHYTRDYNMLVYVTYMGRIKSTVVLTTTGHTDTDVKELEQMANDMIWDKFKELTVVGISSAELNHNGITNLLNIMTCAKGNL